MLVCMFFMIIQSSGQTDVDQSFKDSRFDGFRDIRLSNKTLKPYEFFKGLDSLDARSSADDQISYRLQLYNALKKPYQLTSVELIDSLFRTALPLVPELEVNSKLKLYRSLGLVNLLLKDYVSSIEFNWEVLKLDENDHSALIRNAKSYYRLGDEALSLKVIKYLLEKESLTPKRRKDVLIFRAKMITTTEPMQAIADLNEAAEMMEHMSKYDGIREGYMLAKCHLVLRDTIRAKSYLTRAIRISEKYDIKEGLPKALLISSDILRSEGDLDSARVLAETALDIHQNHFNSNCFNCLVRLTKIYSRQKDSLALDRIRVLHLAELEKMNRNSGNNELLIKEYERQSERINEYFLMTSQIKSRTELSQMLALTILIALALIQLIWWKRKMVFHYWHQLYPVNGQKEMGTTALNEYTKVDAQKFSQGTLVNQMGLSINETDWKVIEVLMDQPLITVEQLAAEVYLSKDGAKTSLRRLYKTFNISGAGAKKVRLIQCLQQLKEQMEIE